MARTWACFDTMPTTREGGLVAQASAAELPYVRRGYDLKEFPFAQLVGEHLSVSDLSRLHEWFPTPALDAENEQSTPLHRKLYSIGTDFIDLYREFLSSWVIPFVGENVVFQAVPNFRFQMPNSKAVSSWHRDRDNGHGEVEVNFWVPLTLVNKGNCVWIESTEDSGEYVPMPASVGEVIIFDGANKKHGNEVNTTESTRVSFEFRIIPVSQYEDRLEKSPVMGKQFAVGDYFEKF